MSALLCSNRKSLLAISVTLFHVVCLKESTHVSEHREEKRLPAERQGRHRPHRHERELLEVPPRKALWVPEGLVELQGPLVTAHKVAEAVELRPHREAEPEGQDSQLLEDLVVQTAQRLADEEPADSILPRLSYRSLLRRAQPIRLRIVLQPSTGGVAMRLVQQDENVRALLGAQA